MATGSMGQHRQLSYDEAHTLFLDRMGAITNGGAKWIVYTVENARLGLKNNFESITGNVLQTKADFGLANIASLSVRRSRQWQKPPFARMASNFENQIKERLQEAQEEMVVSAKEHRVPVPAANIPFIGFVHSLSIKQLLCGVIAGAVASTAVVPFDILQSKVIAGQGGRTIAQVVSTIAHKEGLQSLVRGSLGFNIIKNGLEKGLQFTVFEGVKRNQRRKQLRHPTVLPIPRTIPLSTAGGALAGFFGTLITYPLQPISARNLLQPEKYKSMVGTLKTILKNEGGIRELYRGITPTLISIVPSAAISFYTYETLKSKYVAWENGKKSPDLALLIIGGIAGAVSCTCTFPLDMARKQIVYSALSSKAVNMGSAHYNNTWQALQGVVQRDGFRGLYRGLTASTLQIVPMTAITFFVYEIAKRAFIANGEETSSEVKDASDLPREEQYGMS